MLLTVLRLQLLLPQLLLPQLLLPQLLLPQLLPPAAATPTAAPAAAATPVALRIVPINQLDLEQNLWTIKVSISSKSEIRHFYNTRGEGKVSSFDCIDEVSKAL
jgi:replication factor A1